MFKKAWCVDGMMVRRLSSNYVLRAWSMVLHDANYALLTVALFIALSLMYSLILIRLDVGFLLLGNYYIILSIIYSLALSWALSLSIAINVYNHRHRMRPIGVRISAIASIVGIVPSLCCSTAIPMLISALGGSLLAITTGGKIMGFIAQWDPAIMALALALAYYSLYLSSKGLCTCPITR